MQIPGTTLLLTGATGGLGRAIAAELARRGATLVLSARSPDALDELEGSLPGEHRVVAADLAEPAAADALAEGAGPVDGLVANAALPATGDLGELTADEVERALRVDLEAPIALTHRLLPAMRERGRGHLVYLSSVSGKSAGPYSSLYSAAKFGIRGFAFALRQDLGRDGIGVSIVSPGPIGDAGMFADADGKLPGLGLRTSDEVARGVARAITADRTEIVVASPQLRAMAQFAAVAPGPAGVVSATPLGRRLARQLADGQAGKR